MADADARISRLVLEVVHSVAEGAPPTPPPSGWRRAVVIVMGRALAKKPQIRYRLSTDGATAAAGRRSHTTPRRRATKSKPRPGRKSLARYLQLVIHGPAPPPLSSNQKLRPHLAAPRATPRIRTLGRTVAEQAAQQKAASIGRLPKTLNSEKLKAELALLEGARYGRSSERIERLQLLDRLTRGGQSQRACGGTGQAETDRLGTTRPPAAAGTSAARAGRAHGSLRPPGLRPYQAEPDRHG